jgi:hypothetical protein
MEGEMTMKRKDWIALFCFFPFLFSSLLPEKNTPGRPRYFDGGLKKLEVPVEAPDFVSKILGGGRGLPVMGK